MDYLWTPWRYRYVATAGCLDACVFCHVQKAVDDAEHYILHRGNACFVLLNLFPYTSGHLMVVTQRHVADLSSATTGELHELILLAQRAEHALSCIYQPQGFNLGMNLGNCAGAGVAGHLHFHVLPRWGGDTNFMTVTSETRVLPESLPQTYLRLLPFFSTMG